MKYTSLSLFSLSALLLITPVNAATPVKARLASNAKAALAWQVGALVGIKTLHLRILIEGDAETTKVLTDAGITQSTLEADGAAKLSAVGIKNLAPTQPVMLYVIVQAVRVPGNNQTAITYCLHLMEPSTSVRNPQYVNEGAITYENAGGLEISSTPAVDVSNAVGQMLDEFCSAYRAANGQ